jgi:DNA-binding response OmpR family regulator/Flp pilus assembly protein TadD
MTRTIKLSNKKVLIIDDKLEMRKQLQANLTLSGFEVLHVASSIKEAMEHVESNRYDIVLCEYDLGDNTNGQQFLEYLRTRDVVSRNCIFVIITAENSYESVIAAAECRPDDYLLKPFTFEQIHSRLKHLLVRQAVFESIDRAYDKKNWHKVVAECNKIQALKNKYFTDVLKIKASALMRIGHIEAAVELYKEILEQRNFPWAQLGLARALFWNGDVQAANEISLKLMSTNPQFVANFDFASESLIHENKHEEALEVLKKAAAIFPGNLNRIRQLCTLALVNGQHAMAELQMAEALKKHKHSPVREAADYALLSRAMTEQNKINVALSTLSEAASHFTDDHSAVVLSASNSITHYKAGNLKESEVAINRALACNTYLLPPSIAAILADSCFVVGRDEVADDLLKHIIQNNPEDLRLHNKVKLACAMAGKTVEESTALIEKSTDEIVQINNEGVRKALSGDYKAAIALIEEAAERLPNNLSIVSNAALILAGTLVNGVSKDEFLQCLRYRQNLLDKNPAHPTIAQVEAMLKNAKILA